LYDQLKSVVCGSGKTSQPDRQISIGDSKTLYQSRGNIGELERSVLTMLGVADCVPENMFELFSRFGGHNALQLASETTYRWSDISIPRRAGRDQVESLIGRIKARFQQTGIQCNQLVASVVFPSQFNQGLADFGNKASLLSTVTCRLARALLDSIPVDDRQEVLILCDRHGGRTHYAGLLQQEVSGSFVRVVHERPDESCYRWQVTDRQVEAKFMVKGERYLPVALASMLAKYLRELSMDAWNLFWREQMPDLKPTAGYPQDAKRFKQEIAATQDKLKVSDDLIWRQK
jgi:hypothetical protein